MEPLIKEAATAPHDATALVPGTLRRHATLAIVVGLGVALVGFLRGINEPPPLSRVATTAPSSTNDAVPVAVRYSELPQAHIKVNTDWHSELSSLKFDKPGPFDPVVRTDEMKMATLLDRSRNRAYDSAPPTIPHAIDQNKPANCLACHGEGLNIGDRIASKVSHPHFANCTQCHVESNRSEPALAVASDRENEFSGTGRPGPGTRAWPGAPPTIPHSTWMRQDCTSCHGLVARAGIRTTHPWLTNCVQCHAPSATLDQVNFAKEK